MGIIGFLNSILTAVLSTLGLTQFIYGQAQHTAQETTAYRIQDLVFGNSNILDSGVYGNAALKVELDALGTSLSSDTAAILAAIAALPVTGAPVTLPSTFPPTWANDLGNDVWGTLLPTRSLPAYYYLENGGNAAEQRGEALTIERTPYSDDLWVVSGVWGQEGASDPNVNSTWTLDVTTILASDATSADWLNRVYPAIPWLSPFQNGCLGIQDVGGSNWAWVVDLPIERWLALKSNLGLASATVSAPLWPGLANVVLGTPVAISTGFTVPGPMHGVIVSITAISANKPFFDFDGSRSYRGIGGLAFQDDNAQEELPQTLGFTDAVYVPKAMTEAAACVVRADASMTGTVTPWLHV